MKLVVIKGSDSQKEFRLHDGMNSVGRGVTNRIRLLDPRVSRKHCKIRKIGLSLYLSDLGTKNGTKVNGVLVGEQELKIFDEIHIGKTVLKLVREDYSVETELQKHSRSLWFRFLGIFVRKIRTADAGDGFDKFARRRGRRFWRPHVDTEPPEADSETVFSHSDPDS